MKYKINYRERGQKIPFTFDSEEKAWYNSENERVTDSIMIAKLDRRGAYETNIPFHLIYPSMKSPLELKEESEQKQKKERVPKPKSKSESMLNSILKNTLNNISF
tara:strand:+ start:373 stop:687 length:315 start_codon:yes stop_codon:yes gene_type:complete